MMPESQLYSDAERQGILETARREGLTGPKAAKRFGISTLTFYTWRKRAGSLRRPVRTKAVGALPPSGDGFADLIRDQVWAQVRKLLPEIVRAEVDAALTVPARRRR